MSYNTLTAAILTVLASAVGEYQPTQFQDVERDYQQKASRTPHRKTGIRAAQRAAKKRGK